MGWGHRDSRGRCGLVLAFFCLWATARVPVQRFERGPCQWIASRFCGGMCGLPCFGTSARGGGLRAVSDSPTYRREKRDGMFGVLGMGGQHRRVRVLIGLGSRRSTCFPRTGARDADSDSDVQLQVHAKSCVLSADKMAMERNSCFHHHRREVRLRCAGQCMWSFAHASILFAYCRGPTTRRWRWFLIMGEAPRCVLLLRKRDRADGTTLVLGLLGDKEGGTRILMPYPSVRMHAGAERKRQ